MAIEVRETRVRGGRAAAPAPGAAPGMASVVRRNIQALLEARTAAEQRASREEHIADAITRFTGSMRFVYLHAVLFGGWLLINVGWVPGLRPWDPFPFVMLAMIASVEAIFLSTFVLISQNRMSVMAERRAELDLHISLLAEHEVTRLIQMVDTLSQRLGAGCHGDPETEELKQDVAPEAVLHEIEEAEAQR
ncbi:MAG: DUF1003 domain-containing protein [Armatimonadota bacterium]